MSLYESVILFRQEVSAGQVDATTQAMEQHIIAGGGSVLKKEYWGLRNLAYRMKKNRKAHYVLLNIDAPSAAVKEMERHLSINEEVLRVLTVRVEEHQTEPSIQMSKSDHNERLRPNLRGDEAYFELSDDTTDLAV